MNFTQAPLSKRFIAWLLDFILTFSMSFIVVYTLIYKDMMTIYTTYLNDLISFEEFIDELTIFYASSSYNLMLFMFVIYFVYYVLVAYFLKGATLGKKICSITIINDKNVPPTFVQLFVREIIVKYYANSLFCGIINIISFFKIITSKDNKALHDIIFNTQVVNIDSSNNINNV